MEWVIRRWKPHVVSTMFLSKFFGFLENTGWLLKGKSLASNWRLNQYPGVGKAKQRGISVFLKFRNLEQVLVFACQTAHACTEYTLSEWGFLGWQEEEEEEIFWWYARDLISWSSLKEGYSGAWGQTMLVWTNFVTELLSWGKKKERRFMHLHLTKLVWNRCRMEK